MQKAQNTIISTQKYTDIQNYEYIYGTDVIGTLLT